MSLPQDVTQKLDWLASLVRLGELRQKEIEKATGVDQSQISRILSGKIRRASRNVLILCKYADSLRQYPTPNQDIDTETELLTHVKAIWAGNADTALALKKLLQAVEDLQTLSREKSC